MKSVFLSLAVAGSVIGTHVLNPHFFPGIFTALKERKPPSFSVPTSMKPVEVSSERAGQVQGVMTKAGDLFDTLTKNGATVGKVAVQVVATTPTTEKEVIDVSKVVNQISTQVESIPGNLVQQAKIEYCRKVFEEANKNATPSPSPSP